MNAIFIPSPNFTTGRAGYSPIAIVIHIMEGSLNGTDSWFQNPVSKVSAHYGVGKNGAIHQYVNEKDTAWHAGRVAQPTWELIKPSGNNHFINPNYYTIGIEHEGFEDTDWSEEMYVASSELIKTIAQKWNIPIDRKHVIGHHEIYSVKTCPGTKLDFDKLLSLAKGEVFQVENFDKVLETGKVTSIARLNIRCSPSRAIAPVSVVRANIQLAFDGYTNNGEVINGNSKWFFTHEGNWFWSGAVQ